MKIKNSPLQNTISGNIKPQTGRKFCQKTHLINSYLKIYQKKKKRKKQNTSDSETGNKQYNLKMG